MSDSRSMMIFIYFLLYCNYVIGTNVRKIIRKFEYPLERDMPDAFYWLQCYVSLFNRLPKFIGKEKTEIIYNQIKDMENLELKDGFYERLLRTPHKKLTFFRYKQIGYRFNEVLSLLNKKRSAIMNLSKLNKGHNGCTLSDIQLIIKIAPHLSERSYIINILLPRIMDEQIISCINSFNSIISLTLKLLAKSDLKIIYQIEEKLSEKFNIGKSMFRIDDEITKNVIKIAIELVLKENNPIFDDEPDLTSDNYYQIFMQTYELEIMKPTSKICAILYPIMNEYLKFRRLTFGYMDRNRFGYDVFEDLNEEASRLRLACLLSSKDDFEYFEQILAGMWFNYFKDESRF